MAGDVDVTPYLSNSLNFGDMSDLAMKANSQERQAATEGEAIAMRAGMGAAGAAQRGMIAGRQAMAIGQAKADATRAEAMGGLAQTALGAFGKFGNIGKSSMTGGYTSKWQPPSNFWNF